MSVKLYYAHDPMCSWCWAFRPALVSLLEGLPKQVTLVRLLGGLAPDTEVPMSKETQEYVRGHWQTIQDQVPGTTFNYDFWSNCEPRRSTYPACRAVIAARQQGAEFDATMIFAIQQAYYLQARNPSLLSTLIELSTEIGIDKDKFAFDVQSSEINEALQQEVKQSHRLGLNSFPSLLLDYGKDQVSINVNYVSPQIMLEEINRII
ncbi:MAG: DsbA family protein [marine bacterium B5-7]|nr:MAG: DsbA family protein [marine bacterium B5-7]